VGLIRISVFGGETRPAFTGLHGGQLPHARKAQHPQETLGRDSDGRDKATLQLSGRDPEMSGDFIDRAERRGAREPVDELDQSRVWRND
jgi:hypothetical protein